MSRRRAAVASAPSTKARLRPCGGDLAADDDLVAVGVSKIASIVAVSSPVRTRSAEARPPRSRPTASTRIDLPAPVSPVRTLRPGLELDLDAVDDGEVADAEEAQHGERQAGGTRPKVVERRKFHRIIRLTAHPGACYALRDSRCPSGALRMLRRLVCARLDTAAPCAAGAGRRQSGRWRPASDTDIVTSSRRRARSPRPSWSSCSSSRSCPGAIILYKLWPFSRVGAADGDVPRRLPQSSKFSEVQAVCRTLARQPARRPLPGRLRRAERAAPARGRTAEPADPAPPDVQR